MRYSTIAPTIGASDGRLAMQGERRLMLAVLEDGLRTLLGARLGRTNPKWVRRELDWLTSEDRSAPFAYESLCDALDIDASWLRHRVLDAIRMPAAHAFGGAPAAGRRRTGASA